MLVARVTSLSQAKFYLNVAKSTGDVRYVEAVIDFFMRSEPECPIAEYLSIVATYLRYGKVDKAREMINDVLDFIGGGCGKKDKYDGVEPDTGGGDAGGEAGVCRNKSEGALSDSP